MRQEWTTSCQGLAFSFQISGWLRVRRWMGAFGEGAVAHLHDIQSAGLMPGSARCRTVCPCKGMGWYATTPMVFQCGLPAHLHRVYPPPLPPSNDGANKSSSRDSKGPAAAIRAIALNIDSKAAADGPGHIALTHSVGPGGGGGVWGDHCANPYSAPLTEAATAVAAIELTFKPNSEGESLHCTRTAHCFSTTSPPKEPQTHPFQTHLP